MKKTEYTNYQSPFSWRYGSERMREIFSEQNKYRLWRKIWVELARAQKELGLVSDEELADLEDNQNNIDIERIWEIEKDTRHDVVAAIKEFAEKAKKGCGKIHLGATSMDITDNAETVRLTEAMRILENELKNLLLAFSKRIRQYAQTTCMGYTHLQPAEPTTLGYRFAFYAQELLLDLEFLKFVKKNLKGKGLKGAVGTSASYVKLLDENKAEEMEIRVLEKLGIKAFEITNQTSPRKIELWIADLLASIAQSLNKFAFDLRIMQSPGFGELAESFGKSQVGSSAMPFKKNPIKSEQICSLARLVANLSKISWDNASNTLLERTLDDSANRRVAIPEMFLALDEMLTSAKNVIDGLIINEQRINKNLEKYWPFSVTEIIMAEFVKKGMDRQIVHETLREVSMKAWEDIQAGKSNPMKEILLNTKQGKIFSEKELDLMMDPKNHIGNAKEKALTIAEQIDNLKSHE